MIRYNAHSYMSIGAVPSDDPEGEELDQVMIKWTDDPEQLSESFKKAANFIDTYKETCSFDISID